MTRNSGRRNLSSLEDNYPDQYDFNVAAKSMINMTSKQQQPQHYNDDNEPNSETLERGRRKRFRYFVASLGLTVAAANCYAQATFCIAIVEMVLPADYVFKGESGPLQTVKVVPSDLLESINNNHTITINKQPQQPVEDLENFSCPVEYKYRDYYDEWRFPNASSSSSSSSPLTNLLINKATPSSSSHVIDISNRFDWDASRQGLLLGAFAMGMAPLQVLGGRLAEIYGAKWVLLVGCIGTALTNLTIPALAHFSYTLLVVNRVVMGIAQAGMEPGLMCLMAQWLAPSETGFFISMLLFALCIGFFLGSLLSSFLLTIGLGWALTYYVTGGLNLIMSIVWLVYASKGPKESKLISAEELAYIVHEQQQERLKSSSMHMDQDECSAVNNDLATTTTTTIQDNTIPGTGCHGGDEKQVEGNAPWMNILRTPSVWAFIICKISVRWCADVLTIELPTYLANVLHLSIKLNGILNSLSSAFFAIFSFITGYFVNELLKRTHEAGSRGEQQAASGGSRIGGGGNWRTRRRTLMSKTTLRKLFQSVASFGSAISIFLMTHYDCNIQLSMGMMFVLSACLMMGTGGELQIPYDMTSRYPGTLHGMACTLSVSGWLAPPLIGLILGDQPSSRHRWSLVWYLTASINFIGGLVFVLFADASPRNFDKRRPAAAASGKQATAGGGKTIQQQQQQNNLLVDNNSHQQYQQQQQQRHQSKAALLHRSTSCNSDGNTGTNNQATVVDLSVPRWPTAPRPSATSTTTNSNSNSNNSPSTTTFDCGGLLKIRQLEGSLLSPSSQLDSMLSADQLTDTMFPYQPQQTKNNNHTTNENGLSDGLLASGWFWFGGTKTKTTTTTNSKRERERRKRQPQQQANGNVLGLERQLQSEARRTTETTSSSKSKIITRL